MTLKPRRRPLAIDALGQAVVDAAVRWQSVVREGNPTQRHEQERVLLMLTRQYIALLNADPPSPTKRRA